MPIFQIKNNLGLFQKTKNPLYAWKAIEAASTMNKAMKTPIPDELLDFLFEMAQSILKVANSSLKPAQRPIALAKALGLHKNEVGQGSAFTEFQNEYDSRNVALDTADKIEFYGAGKSDYAFEDIATEKNLSKATVRRNYLKHLKRWQEEAKKLINNGAVTYHDGRAEIVAVGTRDDLRESREILKVIDSKNAG